MTGFEPIVEQAAIKWLVRLGYAYVPGWELAPDGSSPGRTTCSTRSR
ncbi:MAG: hypothetical protein HY744_14320 [Deltaproteobacteria bacterium]|nr:hypothetical protein [Deltaproteobacteria bacterium]